MRARNSAALALAALLTACAGTASPTTTGNRAVLEVQCPVPDAVLWVDGRYIAQLRDLRGGIALRPGPHQIELRHDRYHAHYAEITIRPGQHLRLPIALAESLP
jgi:hypothetical protein